jgi:hypothetical protein
VVVTDAAVARTASAVPQAGAARTAARATTAHAVLGRTIPATVPAAYVSEVAASTARPSASSRALQNRSTKEATSTRPSGRAR